MQTRIQITSAYPHLQSSLKIGGVYLLDVDDSNMIKTTETQDGQFPDQVDVMAAYPMSLQSTDRNLSALNPFLLASASQYAGTGVDVFVVRGSEVLPFRKLYVKSIDDSTGTIGVELHLGLDFWTDRAGNLKINEIPYTPIDFTKNNVHLINVNEAQYTNGDNGVIFPWVFYGGLLKPDTVTLADLRPFVHLYGLLKKGFAKIDHCFTSPFLETPFGRRLICYFLRPNYGDDVSNNKRRALEVVLSQDVIIANQNKLYNNFPFDRVAMDFNGNYSTITPPFATDSAYYWLGPGFVGTIEWEITLVIKANDTEDVDFIVEAPNVTNELWVEIPGPVGKLMLKKMDYREGGLGVTQVTSYGNKTSTITLKGKYEDAQIPPDSKLYVKVFYDLGRKNAILAKRDVTLKAGSWFTITPKKSIYSEGDLIDLYNELDSSISLLDVFRATAHLINGRIFYNHARRHIALYPPYDVNVFGDDVEGFYQNDYIELSNEDLQPMSLKRSRDKDIESYDMLWGFARSTDPTITTDTALSDNTMQIFDRKKRVGVGKNTGKTIELRNPLFEPTVNKAFNVLTYYDETDPSLNRVPLDMPYLTDNTSYKENADKTTYKISYNIRPRILYAAGIQAYRIKDEAGNMQVPGAPYDYIDTNPFYAFDLPNMVLAAGPGNPIDKYLMYGDLRAKDLYSMFYERDTRETYFNLPYEFLVFLNSSNYTRANFRRRMVIHYMDMMFTGRLIEKRDYDGGLSGISTPVVIYPSKGSYLPRVDFDPPLEIRTECDTGDLFIDVTESGGDYTAALGGTSSSTILSVSYSWRYVDDTSWTVGDTVTNPDHDFIFRMQVVFDDDCPDFIVKKTIFPCRNTIVPLITYNPVTGCLSAAYDTDFIYSPVDTVAITYNYDGGSWNTYTGPICSIPPGTTDVNIHFEITFTGGCPMVSFDSVFSFPPTSYDCDLITAGLTATETPGCFVLPQRTGDVIDEILILDMIFYRYDNADEWQLWDDNTPLSQPVQLRRVVVSEGCGAVEVIMTYPTPP